jgi:dihydrofolate synthase/folylpolyglutamate synthase
MALLGHTLAEIAANKAGIIKPGVPVVVGKTAPEAREVLYQAAEQAGAPWYGEPAEMVRVSRRTEDLSGQTVDVVGRGLDLSGVRFTLNGAYQRDNLALALTAAASLRDQGYRISPETIFPALAAAHIPGRLEQLASSPPIFCDVAHNPHGARALATALKALLPGKSRGLVLGVVDDKDKVAIAAALGPGTRFAVVTRPRGNRSQNWRELADIFKRQCPQLEVLLREEVTDAVTLALQLLAPEEYLLLTGSFYLMDAGRTALRDALKGQKEPTPATLYH